MNLNLRIQFLVPNAIYTDTLYTDDYAAYLAIDWNDPRPIPTWVEIEAVDEELAYPPHLFLSIRLQNWIPTMAADLGDTVPVGTLYKYAQLRLMCNNITEFMPTSAVAQELKKALNDLGELTDVNHEDQRQEILDKLDFWI